MRDWDAWVDTYVVPQFANASYTSDSVPDIKEQLRRHYPAEKYPAMPPLSKECTSDTAMQRLLTLYSGLWRMGLMPAAVAASAAALLWLLKLARPL